MKKLLFFMCLVAFVNPYNSMAMNNEEDFQLFKERTLSETFLKNNRENIDRLKQTGLPLFLITSGDCIVRSLMIILGYGEYKDLYWHERVQSASCSASAVYLAANLYRAGDNKEQQEKIVNDLQVQYNKCTEHHKSVFKRLNKKN